MVLLGGFCFGQDTLVKICWEYYRAILELQRSGIPPERLHPDLERALNAHSLACLPGGTLTALFASAEMQLSLRSGRQEDIRQTPVSMLALTYSNLANEPLDYIFAIRALFPQNASLPAPDYSQDFAAACIDYSRWLVGTGWALSMLSYGSLFLDNHPNVPSWAINFGVRRVPMTGGNYETDGAFLDKPQYLAHVVGSEQSWVQHHEEQRTKVHRTISGEDLDLQHIYPCGTSRKQPSIAFSRESLPMAALTVEGFSLDTVQALSDSSSFERYHAMAVSGLKAAWDFYQQVDAIKTGAARPLITQAGWWEDVTIESDGATSLVLWEQIHNTEAHLFYLSGAAERDEASCAAALVEYCPGLTYVRKDNAGPAPRMAFPPQSVEGQQPQLDSFVLEDGWPAAPKPPAPDETRMMFGATKEGWPVVVPHTTRRGDKIAFFHGVQMPFVLRDCGDGTYRLRGRCHVLGMVYWREWTEEFVASKKVETFTIV